MQSSGLSNMGIFLEQFLNTNLHLLYDPAFILFQRMNELHLVTLLLYGGLIFVPTSFLLLVVLRCIL